MLYFSHFIAFIKRVNSLCESVICVLEMKLNVLLNNIALKKKLESPVVMLWWKILEVRVIVDEKFKVTVTNTLILAKSRLIKIGRVKNNPPPYMIDAVSIAMNNYLSTN